MITCRNVVPYEFEYADHFRSEIIGRQMFPSASGSMIFLIFHYTGCYAKLSIVIYLTFIIQVLFSVFQLSVGNGG